MTKISGKLKIDTVFVLVVFALFTVSAALALTFGGRIYKNIVEVSEKGHDERICLSYIWAKVKSADEAGCVYIGDFNGLPSLILKEEYDGITYQTVIYYYDGWVLELFYEKGLEFTPGDGEAIIKTESLAFKEINDKLIKVTVNSTSLLISPRGEASAIFFDTNRNPLKNGREDAA